MASASIVVSNKDTILGVASGKDDKEKIPTLAFRLQELTLEDGDTKQGAQKQSASTTHDTTVFVVTKVKSQGLVVDSRQFTSKKVAYVYAIGSALFEQMSDPPIRHLSVDVTLQPELRKKKRFTNPTLHSLVKTLRCDDWPKLDTIYNYETRRRHVIALVSKFRSSIKDLPIDDVRSLFEIMKANDGDRKEGCRCASWRILVDEKDIDDADEFDV